MTDFSSLSSNIAPAVIEWQRLHGRHHLPWQTSADPYRVWLSEIMLQQTQVATVVPYYNKFVQAFPNVQALAQASLDEVLALWAGLGYYSRARNLYACARVIVEQWEGRFPLSSEDLQTLPGIGRSTAAAIAAFCYGERAAILDGNVRRVLCRYHGIEGDPTSSKTQNVLWKAAQQALPDATLINRHADSMQRYTQGLMDLGAMICVRRSPACERCPIQSNCVARKSDRTALLPTPRTRKARPEREIHLLLVTRAERIFLIRRPDKGIWASMWSLPEAELEATILEMGVDFSRDNQYKPESMATLTHDLTHFRMILKPWLLALPEPLDANALSLDTMNGVWVDRGNLHLYGIPAPILSLLEEVFNV